MELKSRIEAVLFISASAMEIKDIAQILDADKDDVESALLELIMDYSSRDGALEINDESGYIIQVKNEYIDIVEKLCPVEISPSVLKTLAVIAIKEPVRQTLLKDMRGSNAYEHIKELIGKGLVERKKDPNGRSFNIKTTQKFREYFKINGDINLLKKYLEHDENLKK